MNRAVALLRAINVGGNVVAMQDIARSFLRHGHKEVETWLRTGNVSSLLSRAGRPALMRRSRRTYTKTFG